jgi:hypothetical protein
VKLGVSCRAALLLAPLAVVLVPQSAPADEPAPAPGPDAGAVAVKTPLEGAALDAKLAEIATARKGLKTLRANFTQKRTMKLLATTIESKGQLAFAAQEQRLRWELAPPDDVVYFVGPEGLSYRTRSSRATLPPNAANVARGLADLRALLTGDLSLLKERYVLSGAKTPATVEISGTAKDPRASSVRAFTLVLDKDLVLPVRASLLEGKSDSVDIVFVSPVANGPVDPQTLKP